MQRSTVRNHSGVTRTNRSPNRSQNIIDESYEEGVNTEDSHGVALRAAKEKWNELGPLRLEDIVANSVESID